jgi:succinate dehydrogenase/fumarate reductase cytochrome b subunit
MTTRAEAAPPAREAATEGSGSRRLLALSGIAFVPLFLVGWFASNGLTPEYTAADQEWVNWAHDNQVQARISGFAMLLAAFVFLYFMSGIRTVLVSAESGVRGSFSLGRVAFAGALVGVGAMAMALVTMAAASSEGGNVDPTVAKSVTTGAAGPFMVAAMGFAAFLLAAGLVTLRTGVFARWTGMVALIGAVSFLITFLVVLDGTTGGSPFGYGFFPGAVALVTWTAAASISTYRSTAA